ncbi:hypothetical protein ACIRD8_06885 [Streptomyces sp. NPDC102451]|uniref:hypothetical protein n=1 Tax=Streptomyces sp. NPDC102451 TaxID=3366177 RepID=UPI0038294398
MWESEEFGSEHEGRPGVLLADGSEPGPVYFDAGSGPSVHRSSDWWIYDGSLGAPSATELRGTCSCGWRGSATYPIDWSAVDRRRPYMADTSEPEADWETHIAEVTSRTVPVPADLTALLDQIEARLTSLVADEPLAALRAAAALERLTRRVATDAAFSFDTGDGPEWGAVAQALGVSEKTARSRVTRYVLRR